MLVCANNGNFPAEDAEQLKAALNATCGEIWLGEGGTAYVSVGDRKKHGTTDVNIDGEMYQLDRGQIVPQEKILDIAVEFMNDMKLPACVEWEKI